MSPEKHFLVVETNLLISALFIRSTNTRHVLESLQIRGQLVFSSATYAELEIKIRMVKFDRFTSSSEREVAAESLRSSGVFLGRVYIRRPLTQGRLLCDVGFLPL